MLLDLGNVCVCVYVHSCKKKVNFDNIIALKLLVHQIYSFKSIP